MTKELSQVLAADAVRRLSQEEELNLKPERLLRMRWVLTWCTDSSTNTWKDVSSAPCTNFGSILVMSPQLSCKHLPLKSINSLRSKHLQKSGTCSPIIRENPLDMCVS